MLVFEAPIAPPETPHPAAWAAAGPYRLGILSLPWTVEPDYASVTLPRYLTLL
jgi:hypothetical protein